MKRLAIAMVFLSGCASPWSLADLRPASLAEEGPRAADEAKGRALLIRAAHAHGLSAWRTHETLEVVATDDWSPTMLGRWFSWWEAPAQRLHHRMLAGSFTSQMELLDGPEQGRVLGLQTWRTYKIKDGQAVLTKDDERTRFYLPTLHYFSELPFRLLSATHVVYLGRARFGGRDYERVLVTWGGFEPSKEYDQYDVWIDAERMLIASCRYTVREAFAGAVGTIFFEDHREVSGVILPFLQTVMLDGHDAFDAPPKKNWFHRLSVERAGFDSFAPQRLLPLSAAKVR